jgi:hypothetical protein
VALTPNIGPTDTNVAPKPTRTLGFRNLINYRLRPLLEAGGFRPLIHSLS